MLDFLAVILLKHGLFFLTLIIKSVYQYVKAVHMKQCNILHVTSGMFMIQTISISNKFVWFSNFMNCNFLGGFQQHEYKWSLYYENFNTRSRRRFCFSLSHKNDFNVYCLRFILAFHSYGNKLLLFLNC